jgi:hypothetical protein
LQKICLAFVGLVIFSVAGLCVWVGISISLQQSSASKIITNATVATWIESMDEHMFTFIKHFSQPEWFKKVSDELEKTYGKDEEKLTDEEIKKLRALIEESALIKKSSDEKVDAPPSDQIQNAEVNLQDQSV